ncbi:NUDIX domain-containing protein [Ramlibacter sp.]|uniref:NUDIX domain-containing protein n=1 Tax=Ramlibacter sp. TaxID=1917967 RepID=UPI002D2CE054|nr:NUDIX domain-containing protein [Ramlibacter sp.]HYD75016.1 NUDIX domain-containing protein [Ramlibacter sp.]
MSAPPRGFALAACLSEYQLPDRAQVAQIRAALARAARCILFIDWGWQAPSPAHPFDRETRARMLGESLPQDERERVSFVPVRQHYDPARTLEAVATGVRQAIAGAQERVAWHLPDALREEALDAPLPGEVDWQEDDSRTGERLDALYAAADPAATLVALQEQLAPATVAQLHEWIASPAFDQLRGEWRKMAGEKQAWSVAPYPVVLVTVDAVVLAGDHVLLVRRGRSPGRGLQALPGGFLDPRETVLQAAVRELLEETGLPFTPRELVRRLGEVKVFDHPQRSQRGRIVTHAHRFDLGVSSPPPVQGGDDAAAAHWIPVAQLVAMETQFHDDHFHILDSFLGLTGDA